ncbi:MAG: cytochrome P450 [Burkholderiales bacterium]|nr:cytochrome P450 [Burkholderiales bacterium]
MTTQEHLNPIADASHTAKRQIKDLPGPRPWPLLGNLPQTRPSRMHRDVERWSRKYGPYSRFYVGRTCVFVVADHQAVSQILRDRPDGFRRPSVTAAVSAEMGGDPGVFLVEGSEWRQQRRMVMPAFSAQAIRAYFPLLTRVAMRLRARWATAAQAGQTINLSDDLKRYSVDIIAALALGTEVNTMESGEDAIHHHIDVVMAAVARRSVTPLPYWRYIKLPADRRLDRSLQALQATIIDLVGKGRARLAADPARRAAPPNLLEAMLVAADQEGSGVDDRTVAGNVSTMLLAGEETTANSLAWLLYLLSRNPDALKAAQAEVRRVAPDPAVSSIEQIDAMGYLDACVQESMRLKPVAPFMPLEALRDTTVADVHVPKGSLLWCVMRHDSVDDRWVPHAATFDPTRWLPTADGTTSVEKGAVLPFGGGPRLCPGRYLSLLEIKVAAAMLLSSFDFVAIDTPDGKEAREQMDFIMSPVGLTMRLRPIQATGN